MTTPGTVYTGLAINQAQTRLYAASATGIKVFDSNFNPVSLPGGFTTPPQAAGLVPFNVQTLDGKLYVTYAPEGRPAQTGATPGQGAVAIFDENGGLLGMAAVGGPLAAPWGVALAPGSFGEFGGDLLVGNFSFGASGINAFDPVTGMFEGTIPINVGAGHTARRTMGAWFRDRRQQWKSQYTLLHRWYRRRDPRAVWRHKLFPAPSPVLDCPA